MKKRSVLITMIVAIIMIATLSVSFAAWSNTNAKGDLNINVGDRINLDGGVNATGADTGKTLVPDGALLGANDVFEITLGQVYASFKSGATDTTVSSHKITCDVTITGDLASDFFTYMKIELYTVNASPVLYKTITDAASSSFDWTAGTYSVKVSFIDGKNNENMTNENSIAIAKAAFVINFDINTVAL